MEDARNEELSITPIAPSRAGNSRLFRWDSRKNISASAVLLVVVLLSGCATTNIQRAEQLGALGKAYADAVSAAGDEAMASTITFSLDEIRKERKGGAFRTPADRERA